MAYESKTGASRHPVFSLKLHIVAFGVLCGTHVKMFSKRAAKVRLRIKTDCLGYFIDL